MPDNRVEAEIVFDALKANESLRTLNTEFEKMAQAGATATQGVQAGLTGIEKQARSTLSALQAIRREIALDPSTSFAGQLKGAGITGGTKGFDFPGTTTAKTATDELGRLGIRSKEGREAVKGLRVAFTELSQATPEIATMTTHVTQLGSAFGAAGIGVAALAAGVTLLTEKILERAEAQLKVATADARVNTERLKAGGIEQTTSGLRDLQELRDNAIALSRRGRTDLAQALISDAGLRDLDHVVGQIGLLQRRFQELSAVSGEKGPIGEAAKALTDAARSSEVIAGRLQFKSLSVGQDEVIQKFQRLKEEALAGKISLDEFDKTAKELTRTMGELNQSLGVKEGLENLNRINTVLEQLSPAGESIVALRNKLRDNPIARVLDEAVQRETQFRKQFGGLGEAVIAEFKKVSDGLKNLDLFKEELNRIGRISDISLQQIQGKFARETAQNSIAEQQAAIEAQISQGRREGTLSGPDQERLLEQFAAITRLNPVEAKAVELADKAIRESRERLAQFDQGTPEGRTALATQISFALAQIAKVPVERLPGDLFEQQQELLSKQAELEQQRAEDGVMQAASNQDLVQRLAALTETLTKAVTRIEVIVKPDNAAEIRSLGPTDEVVNDTFNPLGTHVRPGLGTSG